MKQKRAQVWVETVVYTLIGISVITIVLVAAKPKIEETRDRIAIEESLKILNDINSAITKVQDSAGNQQSLSIRFSRGILTIDEIENEISWELNTNYLYSEPGLPISLGKVTVLTSNTSSKFVRIFINYSTVDISTESGGTPIILEKSSNPYNLMFKNDGARINIGVR